MDSKIKYSLIIITIIIVIICGVYVTLTSVGNNSNRITIAGSTTVYPVAEALANAYMEKHPEVKITVSAGDSEVGINTVRSGQADIGTSSRNLTSYEAEGLSQYVIGEDAIAVVVNNQNPINNITLNQLASVYDGDIDNWKQLGGNDDSITPVTREVGSGTRVNFEEMIMGNNSYTKDVVVESSTYAALQRVAVSPNAIGYVAQNAINPQVKVLKINNVSLTQQNVDNGSYPLKRSMLLLVKGTPTGKVKDFIEFCLSSEGQAIVAQIEFNSTNNTVSQNPGIGLSGAG